MGACILIGPGGHPEGTASQLVQNMQCSPAKVSGGACAMESSRPRPWRPPGPCSFGRSSQRPGLFVLKRCIFGIKNNPGLGCLLRALGAEMDCAPSLGRMALLPTMFPCPVSHPLP